jgi:hypothetical protein
MRGGLVASADRMSVGVPDEDLQHQRSEAQHHEDCLLLNLDLGDQSYHSSQS